MEQAKVAVKKKKPGVWDNILGAIGDGVKKVGDYAKERSDPAKLKNYTPAGRFDTAKKHLAPSDTTVQKKKKPMR